MNTFFLLKIHTYTTKTTQTQKHEKTLICNPYIIIYEEKKYVSCNKCYMRLSEMWMIGHEDTDFDKVL